MANTCCWYETRIPESLMKSLIDDLERVDENIFIKSQVNPYNSEIKDSVRKSQHCWIPSGHWIGGLLWHYIRMANKDNFLYDISHIVYCILYIMYYISLVLHLILMLMFFKVSGMVTSF